MKAKTILILLLVFQSLSSFGQSNYFPLWTYHQNNINIHGISVGAGSLRMEPRQTNTNGLKIELIGAGLLVFFAGSDPLESVDSLFLRGYLISEKINGISFSSTGTVCECTTNGLNLGVMGNVNYKINGVNIAGLVNYTQIQNGSQFSLFGNYAGTINGLQIGLVNNAKRLKGFQIGLWNKNNKRSLPLINWSF